MSVLPWASEAEALPTERDPSRIENESATDNEGAVFTGGAGAPLPLPPPPPHAEVVRANIKAMMPLPVSITLACCCYGDKPGQLVSG